MDCTGARALSVFKRRAITAINALVACVPEAANLTALTTTINACTTLEEAQSILNLVLQEAVCYQAQATIHSCDIPDTSCPCRTINVQGADLDRFAFWDSSVTCLVVPVLTTTTHGCVFSPVDDATTQTMMLFLKSLSMPDLVHVGEVFKLSLSLLMDFIHLPKLQFTGDTLNLQQNGCSEFDLSSLVHVGRDFLISANRNVDLIVPTLTLVGGNFIFGGGSLINLDISGLTTFSGDFLGTGSQLSVDSVNNALIQLDTGCALTGAHNVDLSGAGSAAPTGAGVTAKNNLIGRGVTVTTN